MAKDYDVTIGYSPLECVDKRKVQQAIINNKKIIDGYYSSKQEDIILVAGTGNGHEAAELSTVLHQNVIGVDINLVPNQIPRNSDNLTFFVQDLMTLAFADKSFSFIYCNHVLEHVKDHLVVLKELYRVLKDNGVLFIGFPNKHRLVAYTGTTQNASIYDKLKWNLVDYKYRLTGKFENKYGAHAGFAENEFIEDASELFQIIHSVRDQYFLLKYSKHQVGKLFIELLIKTGVKNFVFPSNYFICIKEKILP